MDVATAAGGALQTRLLALPENEEEREGRDAPLTAKPGARVRGASLASIAARSERLKREKRNTRGDEKIKALNDAA